MSLGWQFSPSSSQRAMMLGVLSYVCTAGHPKPGKHIPRCHTHKGQREGSIQGLGEGFQKLCTLIGQSVSQWDILAGSCKGSGHGLLCQLVCVQSHI